MGICNQVNAFFDLIPTPVRLFENDGQGMFHEITSQVGLDKRLGFPMGIDWGNWRGSWRNAEMLVSNLGANTFAGPEGTSHPHWLYELKDGVYRDIHAKTGISDSLPFGWGTAMPDLDNDGDADAILVGDLVQFTYPTGTFPPGTGFPLFQNPGYVWQNQRGRAVISQTLALAGENLPVHGSGGIAYGDLDQDGNVDFVVGGATIPEPTPSFGPLKHFRNPGTACKNRKWLEVGLRSTSGNIFGVGASITVRRAGKPQMKRIYAGSSFASTSSRFVHFGFKTKKEEALVEISWPGGECELFGDVKLNQRVELVEGTGCRVRPKDMDDDAGEQ